MAKKATEETFIDNVISFIKGDNAETTALKIQKSACATIEAQIAIKKSLTIDLEDKVEDCKEKKIKARVNAGKIIDNKEIYVSNLFGAENELQKAQKELETNKKEISLLEVELALIKK